MLPVRARPRPSFGFDLHRFDVRSTLPPALREIMQNGLLDRTFQDALLPEFLYPAVADSRPWRANLGDTQIFTRRGLLAPKTTPITGNDPSPSTYAVEQYQMTMDQYGDSIDTNLLQSAMTLASKFLEDTQVLGIGAGQSLNQIARNRLAVEALARHAAARGLPVGSPADAGVERHNRSHTARATNPQAAVAVHRSSSAH